MIKILSIAGSDCSGGAGIQADIKTITAHKMYAMSVITAITAQNTLGVQGVSALNSDFVSLQIDSCFNDIVPNAVKIGMLFNADIIRAVKNSLLQHNAKNIVCDSVMVSTSGAKLLQDDAINELLSLFEISNIITPNIAEAQVLCNFEILDLEAQKVAAQSIFNNIKTPVLVKGGHLNATDVLFDGKDFSIFKSNFIHTKNTHGTGCTLSSAIACALGRGDSLKNAIQSAKNFIDKALNWQEQIGQGCGAINHYFNIPEFN